MPVGREYSRAAPFLLRPESLPTPDQVKDSSFERPILDTLAEMFSNRVLLHIKPFRRVAFVVAKPMMPSARLKMPVRLLVLQRELTFPIGNPGLDSEPKILRGTKAVEMIGHQEVVPDKPRLSLRPRLMKELVGEGIGQPGGAFIGGDRQQHNIRFAKMDMNPRGGMSSLRHRIISGATHVRQNTAFRLKRKARQ